MGVDLEVGRNGERQPLLAGKSSKSAGSSSRGKRREKRVRGSVLYTVFCTIVVALGPITFGFSVGYSSPTQQKLTEDLGLSLSEFSMYGSLVNAGAMAGAILSGRIADRFGRKGALVIASIPHIAGWILNALAMVSSFSLSIQHHEVSFLFQNVASLYIARLLVGFGVGVISFTVPMYIAEISPKNLRGSLGAINQLSVTTGIFLSYLGGLVLPWRTLALVGVAPCSVLLVGLFFIPESPRWLAKMGIEDTLITSLQALRGKDSDISSEVSEIKDAVDISYKQEANVRMSDLCKKTIFLPLTITIGLLLLQQISGINAILFYSSAIFHSAGFSSSNLASLSLALLQVVMTGVAAVLMDRAGRRLLLMVSGAGMAVSCFLVGFAFYLQQHMDATSHFAPFVGNLALISLLVYITSFALGMGPIPWIIMSEVLPSHIKGLGGSVATLVNWTFSWLVTMSFNFLLNWSSTGSFALFAGMCAFTVLFVAVLVPETRGRTLEEIEALFQE
ncbi:sugar transporter ERD6-like 4 isoform X1 [Selaginella moellendorffii]|uniref:sugar transporter ERD6-like 4 isoform X1 n=1 Tax=Selaginella moellendorffii TaxID=88036 RepID=UPI000D1C9A4E|nr:sugar transporter ERD6-like 4 isoform X1 [Selaginella moellendorffii]|eukprot:XP_024525314.1 sugar transporter ERD6-like 4 isoform X1 [Selaginella moellendorffii]